MDIDSKVNMSLDEIVRQNSKKRNNRRNGNGNKRSIKSRLSTANNVKKSITVCKIYISYIK